MRAAQSPVVCVRWVRRDIGRLVRGLGCYGETAVWYRYLYSL